MTPERRESKGGEEPADEVYFEDPLDPPPASPEATTPFDPEPQREEMRGTLAAGLVALLAAISIGAVIAVAVGVNAAEIRSIVEVLIPPITTLCGSAVGFYFATSRSND